MIYHASWSRAFGISCFAHMLAITAVAAAIGYIEPMPPPERLISIDLSEVAVSDGSMVSAAPFSDPGSAASAAVEQLQAPASAMQVARQQAARHATSATAAETISQTTASDNGGDGGAATGADAGAGLPVAGAGSSTGTQASSGPALGGSSGGGSADISGIINAFVARVEKQKQYPYMARRRGQEGVVTVNVRLSEAGDLTGAQVMRSSGVTALDEAALSAVRQVTPFRHNSGRTIAMNIPITYRLE